MRKSTRTGLLKRKEQYSAGEVAYMLGVSHRTACSYIDAGVIPGFAFPGSQRRRVLFTAIQKYIAENPKFEFMLLKIEPQGTEK